MNRLSPQSARPLRRILALESSCDETACAVIEAEHEYGHPDHRLLVRSDVVASQAAIHARFGGVVPEVAARPVSYTHLDVYKRQLPDLRRAAKHLRVDQVHRPDVERRRHGLSLIHISPAG